MSRLVFTIVFVVLLVTTVVFNQLHVKTVKGLYPGVISKVG